MDSEGLSTRPSVESKRGLGNYSRPPRENEMYLRVMALSSVVSSEVSIAGMPFLLVFSSGADSAVYLLG